MSNKRNKRKRAQQVRRRQRAPRPPSGTPLTHALQLHRSGEHAAARAAYEAILADDPEHVDALHFLGMLQYLTDDPDAGIANVERSLEINPVYLDACNNLGNMMKLEGRLDEAEALYQRSRALAPDAVDPMINLGVLCRARGALEESRNWYLKALEASPGNVLVHINLGGLLEKQGQLDDALAQYDIARAQQPNARQAAILVERRARLLFLLGRIDETIAVYEEQLRLDPNDANARHMLAAATGRDTPEKPDSNYVKNLFDGFATTFDEVLDNLDYKAPQLINALVDSRYPNNDSTLRIADLGCGTGLCAPGLKPKSRELLGVDLSPGMLTRARTLKLYDALDEADLEAWLSDQTEPFDLMVCADTLCYFGALNAVLSAFHKAMPEGGMVFFTVESSAEVDDYVLQSHGRYAHTSEYVKRCLADADLTPIDFQSVELRLERGEPVAGYLISARRDH